MKLSSNSLWDRELLMQNGEGAGLSCNSTHIFRIQKGWSYSQQYKKRKIYLFELRQLGFYWEHTQYAQAPN